jgi:histidinol-phosphate aminotransferase
MLKPNKKIEKITPYQPGKTIEEIKKLYNLTHVIKLASNENSFGTSPNVIQALKAFAGQAHLYADGSCSDLKAELALKLSVESNNIIVGNGSNEIIELIFKTFVAKGDKILSCAPTFAYYKIAAETTFGEYISVPL